MPTVRHVLVGVVAGGLLMLGGQALADIPDDAPSAPDSAQTVYLCWKDSASPLKQTFLFDRSQALATGKPDCRTAAGSGWHTIEVVPDAIRETSD